MFEFYLGISEQSFRHRRQYIWQVQLAKRVDVLPITRDYISEAEAAFAKKGGQKSKPLEAPAKGH
jgi:cyclopropane-fatty-acyl-phospholipid synthase